MSGAGISEANETSKLLILAGIRVKRRELWVAERISARSGKKDLRPIKIKNSAALNKIYAPENRRAERDF